MSKYDWKYKFTIKHLLTEHPIENTFIEFCSPHFPSTEKDKDYTVGTLTVSLDSLNYHVEDIITEGLKTVIALNNHITLPIEIFKIESPPGILPGMTMKSEGYSSYPFKEPENIPNLWDKYRKLIENKTKYQELTLSIQWFMRSIKSNNPIDKFINSWITFNMLYGWLTGACNHVKGIKGLTGKGIPRLGQQDKITLEHKTILKDLSTRSLIDRHKIDRTKKLRSAISGGDSKKILEGAIEAIGFIRHNIFHGSFKDRTIEAERCIWPLIHLDAEIIKHQLNEI